MPSPDGLPGFPLTMHSLPALATLPALLESIQSPVRGARLSRGSLLLVLLAGVAHALSMAWPVAWSAAWLATFGLAAGQPVWWLQLLALVLLVGSLERCGNARQAALLGWAFATAMQCATWWWLFISLHTYGGLASPLTVLAIVGLAAFLGLYYAAVCGLFIRVAPVNRGGRAIVFASLWLLAELARVAFFTGFPWGEGGYAQLDGPFADLAKLVGVHGLTFAAALLAAASVGLVARPRWSSVVAVVAGLLLAGAGSAALKLEKESVSVFTSTTALASDASPGVSGATRPFSVTLLQGNIPQDEKFQGGKGIPDALKWYGEQLKSASTSLVVTPETALPILPGQLPEGYLQALLNHFTSPAAATTVSTVSTVSTAALIGIPLGNSLQGYTNSVIGLKPSPAAGRADANIYRYDKHHLVPFGEFVHPLFKWYLAIVNIPLSDFNRGAVSQPSFDWQGQRLAPNICYEDLFGEDLAARFRDPALSPTVFVNISNIAWFGNTVAIDQHLNISRMRALEFERPMIRATNTGATVIIDHRGQVTHALPRHTRGALIGEVEGRSGVTPYAWWAARFGLWPLWLMAIATVLVAACARFYWARPRLDA